MRRPLGSAHRSSQVGGPHRTEVPDRRTKKSRRGKPDAPRNGGIGGGWPWLTEALKELDASSRAFKTDLKDLAIRLYKFLLTPTASATATLTVALLQLLE